MHEQAFLPIQIPLVPKKCIIHPDFDWLLSMILAAAFTSLLPSAAAAHPQRARRTTPSPVLSASREFRRTSDLLQVTSDKVTTRQIVNCIGRWKTHQDWDSIGKAAKLDDIRSGDYYDEDLEKLATDFTKGARYYNPRRPMFRNFCKTYGLVQRWVLCENTQLLPFTDEALAASVGATAAELNAEPIDALAANIVFDALCMSMSNLVYRRHIVLLQNDH